MNYKTKEYVTICPHCSNPHPYTEITFPICNDTGACEVQCTRCSSAFIIKLKNPNESNHRSATVLKYYDDERDEYQGSTILANDVIQHSIDLNKNHLEFNYQNEPIYKCSNTCANLETSAITHLESELNSINQEFYSTRNWILSSRTPEMEFFTVPIDVPCACGQEHVATFYTPMELNDKPVPPAKNFLLADISATNLHKSLTGIYSKTHVMNSLEKLIIRWRLKCDQIIIASPFVAHQFVKIDKKLEIWNWLLSMLNPERSVLITRPATYKEYQNVLNHSGLKTDVLERFGLGNKVIEAGTKKQQFHAKVYIGLGEKSEILSGSANLVAGPSLENTSFHELSLEEAMAHYIEPLIKNKLPSPKPRTEYRLEIKKVHGKWKADIVNNPYPF